VSAAAEPPAAPVPAGEWGSTRDAAEKGWGLSEEPAGSEQPELKRVLGPGLLLLFVVGDILGTGVYALTGQVAAEVGGAAWLPFLIAFGVAAVTACSYLELVTKYPQAAGAALYVQKAFGRRSVTFLVAFAVMCSGITSAATASRFFAANLETAFGFDWGRTGVMLIALTFMAVLAVVNLRGVGESARLNVVLTVMELGGLLLVLCAGLWAFAGAAEVDLSRVVAFETTGERHAFVAVTAATSLAFFAMVGFEDSVNMAEETRDPVRVFPRVLLGGLTIAGVIYVLVSIVAVALVPVGDLRASDTPLVEVVRIGAPGLPIADILPFISMFAVANTALINMLMASRLVYGMARRRVLPPVLGRVHPRRRTPWVAIVFTTLVALAVIVYVTLLADSNAIALLGGTTSLLLLAVFAMVNIAVLVLRRDVPEDRTTFRAPTALPILGAVASLYLVTPASGRPVQQYLLALVLVAVGVVLFGGTAMVNRRLGIQMTAGADDIDPAAPPR